MAAIIKLKDKKSKKVYYMEWSTIQDQPLTYGLSLKDFKKYYKEEYGNAGMRDLPDRLKRVEKYGTSMRPGTSIEKLILCNRAGKNEKKLTLDEIILKFCINRPTKK